jgi:hypothetical protein
MQPARTLLRRGGCPILSRCLRKGGIPHPLAAPYLILFVTNHSASMETQVSGHNFTGVPDEPVFGSVGRLERLYLFRLYCIPRGVEQVFRPAVKFDKILRLQPLRYIAHGYTIT